jgi:predicted ABC-type exoprotein transport system permease subunit
VTTTAASTASAETIVLSPSYNLPIAIVFLAVPLFFVQVWVSVAIALFGFFLLVQAATLRLSFTETALDIERGQTLIRRFPYQDWQNWRIFWSPVPILFYFKEVNSIHFLPILFDPKALQACLEARCPRLS